MLTMRKKHRVARIIAREGCAHDQVAGENGGKILAAVNPEIDMAIEERVLDLLDKGRLRRGADGAGSAGRARGDCAERAGGAGRARRVGWSFVAGRANDDDLATRTAALGNQPRHRVCLPECQRTASRPDAQRGHASGSLSLSPSANSLVKASVYWPTSSVSPSVFSCSVGVNNSFSNMSRVISSIRKRTSGG